MTLEGFIQKIAKARIDLANSVEQFGAEITESTLTLIKDRSINEGIEIAGNKQDYSKRQVNTQKFKGKELNARGSKYIQANALGTWHDFRKAQGLRSEKVNLSYTNDMWKGLQVIKTGKFGFGAARSIIGSYDSEVNEKIAQNAERFGDFLKPQPDELEFAQGLIQRKIVNLLRG